MNSVLHTQRPAPVGDGVAAPKMVVVGMSEMAISHSMGEILSVLGLGSCVAIAAYEAKAKIGLLLHAMLPRHRAGSPRTRFVDSGLEAMIETLQAYGVRPQSCRWWLSGGAQMLSVPGSSDTFKIGMQNVEAAMHHMHQYGLKLVQQHVNGTQGRTVRLYMADGSFTVRLAGGAERPLLP